MTEHGTRGDVTIGQAVLADISRCSYHHGSWEMVTSTYLEMGVSRHNGVNLLFGSRNHDSQEVFQVLLDLGRLVHLPSVRTSREGYISQAKFAYP